MAIGHPVIVSTLHTLNEMASARQVSIRHSFERHLYILISVVEVRVVEL